MYNFSVIHDSVLVKWAELNAFIDISDNDEARLEKNNQMTFYY